MARPGKIALGALLLAQGGAALSAPPETEMRLGGVRLSVTPEEMRRLSDLGNAVTAIPAIQDRALAAARRAASSPDARHALATYQLEIARRRGNDALRAEALDALIASRLTRPERLASYLAARGDIAFRGGDNGLASALWTRAAELQPDNPQALINLAQVLQAQADPDGAMALIRRAIALGRQGQTAPPEIWYRQWLSIAYNGHRAAQTAAAGQALVAAYPGPANWRLALVTYRQLLGSQEAAEIDLLRLMRAARAFTQPAEYQRLAQLLLHAGFAAEARDTLEDGIARGIVGREAAPTPEIGREIARALARPAAAPASLAPVPGEIGRAAALAIAGRRADAETAFRAIAARTDGNAMHEEQDIARFWLLWLGQSA